MALAFFNANALEHPQHMFYKKCHFDPLKVYFIILPLYFTTSHLSLEH